MSAYVEPDVDKDEAAGSGVTGTVHPRRVGRVTLALLVLLVLAAAVGPLFAESPSKIDLNVRLQPPVGFGGTWAHPLGTDGLGRDVLAGLVNGARSSLIVGLGAAAVAALFGVTLGLLGGYRGGFVDNLIGWLVDLQLAFPAILLVLVIAAYVSAGLVPLILTLAFVSWMVFARLSRSLALSMRESEFVAAAQLAGSRTGRILRRHLLPNMLSPLLTLTLLEVARLMLAESGLSYLGLGIQRPEVSWGLMIAEGQQYLRTAWWTVITPGVTLVLALLLFNQLARAASPDRTLSRPPA